MSASLSGTPFVSVVIRSRNEADRLRLTLASLEGQEDCELLVVNDGSSDHTPSVLAEAAGRLPLTVVTHAAARGRSAAANAGAGAARGMVLLFLDGDTLAGPDCVRRHADLHRSGAAVIGRGDPRHLRCTRLLRDPETGVPWAEAAETLSRRPASELERMRVTRDQLRHDFASIDARAEPGIYPGSGPRRLHELETEALTGHPDCGVLWSAASGSNMSVPRMAFLEAGGFNERIDINEHRELALRLTGRGLRVAAVPGARSYHLTHRSGWRDPLVDTAWEAEFLREHPIRAVALQPVFWASLSPNPQVPPPYLIRSLPELERAASGGLGLDYDVARAGLRLARLGAAFWRDSPRPDEARAGMA